MRWSSGCRARWTAWPRSKNNSDRRNNALRSRNWITKEVDLFLPRFKVNSQIALAEVLQSLGMKQAFTKSANFSGITDEPLWISAVIHEAVVEVDEKGTEAAAATAIVFPTAAAPAEEPPKPKLFRADHPFVYAIRHRETGDVLFWGRVEKPE